MSPNQHLHTKGYGLPITCHLVGDVGAQPRFLVSGVDATLREVITTNRNFDDQVKLEIYILFLKIAIKSFWKFQVVSYILVERSHNGIGSIGPDVGGVGESAEFPETSRIGRSDSADVNVVHVYDRIRL